MPRRRSESYSTDSESKPPTKSAKVALPHLPTEIWMKIFEFALIGEDNSTRNRCNFSRVCSTWRDTLREAKFWADIDLSYGWVKNPRTILQSLMKANDLKPSDIQAIRASKCLNASTAFVKWLAHTFPHLDTLDLSGTPFLNKVSATDFRMMMMNFNELRHLDVSYPGYEQPRSFSFLFSSTTLPKLKQLKIVNTNFGVMSREMERFSTIFLGDTVPLLNWVSDSLTQIELIGNKFSSLYGVLGKLPPSIRIVHLHCAVASGSHTSIPQNKTFYFPELIELSLSIHRESQDTSLDRLVGESKQLRHLSVSNWAFTRGNYELNLPELEFLGLTSTKTPRVCSFTSTKLEELDLRKCQLSNKGFTELIENVTSGENQIKTINAFGSSLTMEHLRSLLVNTRSTLHALDITGCRELDRGLKGKYAGQQELMMLQEKLENSSE